MGFSILCIVAAFVLYTLAVWSEHFSRKLKPWMVAVFALGFVGDLLGTSLMFLRAAEKFTMSVHSLSGSAALLIMFLHLSWAVLALAKRGKAEEYFTRFSRFAWGLWLVAFISGIPNGI